MESLGLVGFIFGMAAFGLAFRIDAKVIKLERRVEQLEKKVSA